jgi:ribosomal protein L11 methyltransferase
MTSYLSLRYTIIEEQYEQAYAALSDMPVPYLGISEGQDELTVFYQIAGQEGFQLMVEKAIRLKFKTFNVSFAHCETSIIAEQNWNTEWEESIEPVWVNERIVITPSWKQHRVTAPITILIDPKMSFGTGHHETTRMMAMLLERCIHTGSTWIDAGTGTGILAILAIRLGAASVMAFDNDTWSVNNTIENFLLNKISAGNNYTVIQADVNTVSLIQCNGITANLHKNLLDANFERFYEALTTFRGDLLVSGLLRYDHDDVVRRATDCGFHHRSTATEGEWIALHFSV